MGAVATRSGSAEALHNTGADRIRVDRVVTAGQVIDRSAVIQRDDPEWDVASRNVVGDPHVLVTTFEFVAAGEATQDVADVALEVETDGSVEESVVVAARDSIIPGHATGSSRRSEVETSKPRRLWDEVGIQLLVQETAREAEAAHQSARRRVDGLERYIVGVLTTALAVSQLTATELAYGSPEIHWLGESEKVEVTG